jgi:hypothetical protein
MQEQHIAYLKTKVQRIVRKQISGAYLICGFFSRAINRTDYVAAND